MKFQQYVTQSGKLLVYMNPEDLTLPLPEGVQITDNQDYYNNTYFPLQCFNAETYDTLKRRDEAAWSVVYGSVNKFLSMTGKDINKQICMTFMMMHDILNTMTSTNMADCIRIKGDALNELDKNTDICTKLERFVELDMPIPDLEDVGGRPQDTEEMTFRRPHVVQLTSIALLCKLLSPVFGQFFWQYKKNTNMDNNIKEIHCATILTPLFNRRYRDLILKLNNFINNILAQQIKQKDDIVSAVNGNTINSQALSGSSSIFTRKLITVDLYKTDGNIMTYITTCLKNSVDTQYRTASSKNNIKERDTNSLKDTASDEGNASRLENESFTSTKTADVPIITEWMIERATDKWMHMCDMPKEIYDQAMAYYRSNLPPMTPISNYLLCTYFGTDIGGAAGISMISAMSYTNLAVILQYILITKLQYFDLAHAIMLIPLNRLKSQLTNIDNKVRMTWSNTYAYRNFKNKFTHGIGDRECDAKLKEIVEFLTVRVHQYNTAPVFKSICLTVQIYRSG